jgi:Zn-dependent peptidase ImmA (M78 family)/transcriptional regulator with XRE-family HTH domain
MPRASFEVQVEPTVMKWARESAGRTIGDVAKRLAVNEELITGWENGKKNPTITQLRNLAKYFQRSPDVFLLSEPPIEPQIPQDFRNLPNGEKLPFHAETRFALRKARRLQLIAMELRGEFHNDLFYKISNVTKSDDPELLASRVRSLLGIEFQTQSKWKDDADALKQWIKFVENIGIVVIQIPMPIEDARAFSLARDGYPVIVLNLTDSKNARIFSLFHELGHIILNEEGICDPGGNPETSKNATSEEFCNHFAGAFLVPKEDLLNHNIVLGRNPNDVWSEKSIRSLSIVLGRNPNDVWSEKSIRSLSRNFKVSNEVILRRLLILGYASSEFYGMKRQEWIVRDKERQTEKEKKRDEQEKQGGGRNVARECIQRNGEPIVSLILESYYDNKLTKCDIADYLEVNLKHLPKIEKTLWS